MSALRHDLAFAVRQLRRSPAFSITVLITLALSIAATATLAAVLHSSLLSTLPYPQPNQLVEITDINLRGIAATGLVSVPRVDDLRSLTTAKPGRAAFSAVTALYRNAGQLAAEGHEPVSTAGVAVTGDFFSTLAVRAALGRVLTPADDLAGNGLVLVLSDHLWRSTFAADPAVLGRTVRLGTDQATIVGVMPPSFNLPDSADLWYPARLASLRFGSYRGDGARFVRVFARLAPGVSLTEARLATRLLADRLARTYPSTDAPWGFALTSLRSSLFSSLHQGLFLLSAAIALVYLIVVVNLAGLQLARNARRSPEFAIRSALGISRNRLLLQLATESTLLIGCGTIIGLALAEALLHVLRGSLPATLFLIEAPHFNISTFLTVAALALVTDLLVIALSLVRHPMRPASTRTTVRPKRRLGRLVVATQIALTLVLLTLSTGVLSGLFRLLQTPLGFSPSHVLTCTIDLGWNVPSAERHRLYQQVESALVAVPGVETVGAATALPLSGFSLRSTYDIAGQPLTPNHDTVTAESRSITAAYPRSLGIPLLAGRLFTDRDADVNAPPVVAVNQAFVHRFFPNGNPLGQHLLSPGYQPGAPSRSSEIVAVLANVHGTGGPLSPAAGPEIYNPEDGDWPHMQFAIRTTLSAATLEPTLRRLVGRLNTSASVSTLTELSTSLDEALAQPRWSAALLSAFAALSLLLVTLGIYGLVAFEVTERTRELALRLALGATRPALLRMLLGQSATLLALGLAAGLLASAAAARLLHAATADLLGPTSPLLLLGTVMMLAAAVTLATFVPARRATHLDPMHALRSE